MRLLRLLSVILVVVLAAMSGITHAGGKGPTLTEQIKETMTKVQSGKTVDSRTEAAKHFASLTRKISNKEVTETLVADLVSLLDSPDDSVRFWVATALGNLGPVAKTAVPKLEELLPKAECLNGALTSAGAIRGALFKMGVSRPPEVHCERTPIAF
jgi:HEAT repeat protein